ncbi:unnamed protein product, partial [Discosporangium mesarthrocarpum]
GSENGELKLSAEEREREDQELVDLCMVIEREKQNAITHQEDSAVAQAREEIAKELRTTNSGMPTQEMETLISCEMEQVAAMWKDQEETLSDILATLLTAMEDRGLSARAALCELERAAANEGLKEREG